MKKLTEREKSILKWGIAYGRREMSWDLAVWKNGEQLVGTMERPYKEFVKPYQESMKHEESELGIKGCQMLGCDGCEDCEK